MGENGRSQGERSRLEGGVVEFHLHPDLGGTLAHLFLGDIDAAGGVVGERNATFLSHDEPYGTVDTSVDTKQNVVDGDDIGASLVISPHDDLIASAGLECSPDFDDESRVATSMSADQLLIDVDFGASAHAFKAKKDPFVFPLGRTVDVFAIVASSFIEVIVTSLHVLGVPGVRNGDGFPFTIPLRGRLHDIFGKGTFLKFPTLIERQGLTGMNG